MKRAKKIGLFVIILVTVVCVLTVMTYLRHQREMRTARERLLAGSQVIETASGPIEYAIVGDGYPVLVAHASGGGYDQGLMISEAWVGNGFKRIAISRFGYLRTPFPDDASPALQADVYAGLLDALNIERVAIMGASGGGPSALQFAQRYPDRCAALIMIAAVSHEIPQLSPTQQRAFKLIFGSDFIFWLVTKAFQAKLTSMFGVPPAVQAKLTTAQKDSISYLFNSMHPISLRQVGIFSDMNPHTHDLFLEHITVPTLVIHTIDDPLVPFEHGQFTAYNIPDARLVELQSGGHMMIGQYRKIRSEVVNFLGRHM